jgi:hypothetical protein
MKSSPSQCLHSKGSFRFGPHPATKSPEYPTAAGWQPLTQASCDNANILVERFGPEPGATVFLTLLNDTRDTQSGTVTADLKALGFKQPAAARELVSGNTATPSGRGWQVSLLPQQTEVLCLRRKLD